MYLTYYVNLVRIKRSVWSEMTFTLKEKCPLKNKSEFYIKDDARTEQ